MKCEAIFANSSGYSVRKMCQAMGVKESSYYQWKHGQKRRDERIAAEKEEMMPVQQVFEETNRTYGCRRIKQALRSIGKEMGEWKIRRIMRENGVLPGANKEVQAGKTLKARWTIL